MTAPTPPGAHWRHIPPDTWEYADGDWLYAKDPATGNWDWQWTGTGAAPASPASPPASAYPTYSGTWPPAAPAAATAAHWRFVPTPANPNRWEYADGDWVYAQDPAGNWGWTWTGTGLAPVAPTSPPPTAYPTYAGTWPPPAAVAGPAMPWPAPIAATAAGATGPVLLPTGVAAPAGPATGGAAGGAAGGAGATATARSRSSRGWLVPLLAAAAAIFLVLFVLANFHLVHFGASGYVGASAGNPGVVPAAGPAVEGVAGGGDNASAGATVSAGAAGSGTPAPTVTASAAATVPAASNLGPHCNDAVPAQPAHWLIMQQHPPVGSPLSLKELMAVANGGGNAADYAGDAASNQTMQAWLHDVHCDGLFGMIEVPNWYLNGSLGGSGGLVSGVGNDPTLAAWVVGMNDLNVDCTGMSDAQCVSAHANTVGKVIGQIHDAGSNKPVICLLDKLEQSQEQLFTNAGCDVDNIVFLPWKVSKFSWMSRSLLPSAGGQAKALNGAKAMTGIQMFDWNDSPGDAADLGMIVRSTPSPSDVAGMAQQTINGGSQNIFLVTMEKPHGGDEDDVSYDQRCVSAVHDTMVGASISP